MVPADLNCTPQWSPPSDGGSTGRHGAAGGRHARAAMEPAVGRREHGSQETSRLSCMDSAGCEPQVNHGTGSRSMDLSRCKKRALTCVRALPGLKVTTLALAAQMTTARSCMPLLMVAREEQAGRVTGLD